jgi:hypothetical protein
MEANWMARGGVDQVGSRSAALSSAALCTIKRAVLAGLVALTPGFAGSLLVTTFSPVAPVFAQTGAGPGALPSTTIAPAASGAPAAPSAFAKPSTESGVEESGGGGEEGMPAATPAPTHKPRHKLRHYSTSTVSAQSSTEVEPANGKLKLREDSWAYSRPAKSSKRIESVHADKFVNVTGTTRHYLQVQLKSGTTGFVPVSAVDLIRPTDKVFQLTADTPVLAEPNHWAKKISEVHRGHSVHAIGISLNYMKIRMKDGVEGFISTTALE